jgi:hypothetical protein
MGFHPEMVPYCGKTFSVAPRHQRENRQTGHSEEFVPRARWCGLPRSLHATAQLPPGPATLLERDLA